MHKYYLENNYFDSSSNRKYKNYIDGKIVCVIILIKISSRL